VDDHDDLDGNTQTTAAGLSRLAASLSELLREQAIDSRFGSKLLRRMEKEAKRLNDNGPAKAEKKAVSEALADLERALREREAALLVQAHARLRDGGESAEAPAGKEKDKDKEKDKPAKTKKAASKSEASDEA
jgi:hypothetical protein